MVVIASCACCELYVMINMTGHSHIKDSIPCSSLWPFASQVSDPAVLVSFFRNI